VRRVLGLLPTNLDSAWLDIESGSPEYGVDPEKEFCAETTEKLLALGTYRLRQCLAVLQRSEARQILIDYWMGTRIQAWETATASSLWKMWACSSAGRASALQARSLLPNPPSFALRF
jgi:hypothetical protein